MSGFPEMAEVRAAVADQSVDLFEAHGIERFRFGLVKFGQDVFRVIPAFRGKMMILLRLSALSVCCET